MDAEEEETTTTTVSLNEQLLQSHELTERLFINLKVISRLKPGDKITISDNLMNIDHRYFQTLVRWIVHDNRNTTIQFIEQVVRDALEYNERILRNENVSVVGSAFTSETRNHIILRMTNELDKCIEGLNNLKQTYGDDCLMECRIDYIIDQIKIRINNNTKRLEIQESV